MLSDVRYDDGRSHSSANKKGETLLWFPFLHFWVTQHLTRVWMFIGGEISKSSHQALSDYPSVQIDRENQRSSSAL